MIAATATTKITIGDDDVTYTECIPNTKMTLEEASQITQLTLDMLKGKSLPLLCDISNVIKMPQNCRNHFAGPEHSKTFTKSALIINSPVSKIIGNFFLGLNKPLKPTKLFTKKENALKWLKEE